MVTPLLKDTSEIQKPPETGHHCSVPFEVPHIDTCTFESSEICTPPYRTADCGSSGVLIIEVTLYKTVYCGPNGVLILEVSLYRTAYCGPSGILTMEGPLYCLF